MIGPKTLETDFAPQAFLTAYAQAFAQGTAVDVAAFYSAPCLSVRGDGSRVVWTTAAEVEGFFAGVLEAYRARGMAGFAGRPVACVPMGAGCCALTCAWDMLEATGGVIAAWQQTYTLRRIGDDWRIVVSLFHAEDRSRP